MGYTEVFFVIKMSQETGKGNVEKNPQKQGGTDTNCQECRLFTSRTGLISVKIIFTA